MNPSEIASLPPLFKPILSEFVNNGDDSWDARKCVLDSGTDIDNCDENIDDSQHESHDENVEVIESELLVGPVAQSGSLASVNY
jgi:hypothetical protein